MSKLADVVAGKNVRPQRRLPLEEVLPNLRDTLDRVSSVADAKAAGYLIRGVMTGDDGGGGIKDLTGALKDVHEIVSSEQQRQRQMADEAEARRREAAALEASATVEAQKVRQEGELGVGRLMADVIDKVASTAKPASSPTQDWAAVISALAPLVAPLLERRDDTATVLREMVRDFRDELRSLREKVEQSKQTQNTDPLDLLKRMQELGIGGFMSPKERIDMMRLDTEREIGLRKLQLEEGTQSAQAQERASMMQMLTQAMESGAIKFGGRATNDTVGEQDVAAQYRLRCAACGHVWYGDTTSEITRCPQCGKTLRRRDAAAS